MRRRKLEATLKALPGFRKPFDLEFAIALAVAAHRRQTSRSGELAIMHPLRVMSLVAHLGDDYAIVAVLHDSLEQTALTEAFLRQVGCPRAELRSIVTLTRLPDEPYLEAIERAAASNLTREIAQASILDHLRYSLPRLPRAQQGPEYERLNAASATLNRSR